MSIKREPFPSIKTNNQQYQQSSGGSIYSSNSAPVQYRKACNENQVHRQRQPRDSKKQLVQDVYQTKNYVWEHVQMKINKANLSKEKQEKTLEEIQKKLIAALNQKSQFESSYKGYATKLKKIEVRLQKEVDEMEIIDLKEQSIFIDSELQKLRALILMLDAKIQKLKASVNRWQGLISSTEEYIYQKSIQFQRKRFPLTNRRNQNE